MKLDNLNLVELNAQEQKDTEGGFPWLPAAIIATVISAVNNWGDIREGWIDGAAGHPRH